MEAAAFPAAPKKPPPCSFSSSSLPKPLPCHSLRYFPNSVRRSFVSSSFPQREATTTHSSTMYPTTHPKVPCEVHVCTEDGLFTEVSKFSSRFHLQICETYVISGTLQKHLLPVRNGPRLASDMSGGIRMADPS